MLSRGDLLYIRDIVFAFGHDYADLTSYEDKMEAIRIIDKELDRLTEQPRTQADIGDENEETLYHSGHTS